MNSETCCEESQTQQRLRDTPMSKFTSKTSVILVAITVSANFALVSLLFFLLATDAEKPQVFRSKGYKVGVRQIAVTEKMVKYYSENPVVPTKDGVPVDYSREDAEDDCDADDDEEIAHHEDHIHDDAEDFGRDMCPQKSPCDAPEIRDLYVNWPYRHTFNMVWYVPKNDYGDTFYEDSEKLIAGNMAAINRQYAPAGFKFESIVKKIELEGPNGTVLNDLYIGKSKGCNDEWAQPCFTPTEFLDIVAPNSTWQTSGTFSIIATKLQKPRVNGFAVLPYRPLRGLLAMKYTTIGAEKTTISHELGHALGLLHVFAGVSSIKHCNDPCYEPEPSNLVGDFCNDTVPEPKHWECSKVPPYGVDGKNDYRDVCNEERTEWESINFFNLMGYAKNQTCRSLFTEQQIWRMRCSVDMLIGDREDPTLNLPTRE